MPTVYSVSQNAGSGVLSITVNHTINGAADRFLVVRVDFRGAATISSVVWSVGASNYSLTSAIASGISPNSSIWTLVNPVSGAGTVTVTFTVLVAGVVGVSDYSDVDQNTPFDGATSASGSSTTPSVNVTSRVGDIVVDSVAANAQAGTETATVGANQTQDYTDIQGAGATWVRGCGSHEDGATTVTMDWTLSVSRAWETTAINIRNFPRRLRTLTGNQL